MQTKHGYHSFMQKYFKKMHASFTIISGLTRYVGYFIAFSYIPIPNQQRRIQPTYEVIMMQLL